MKKIFIPTPLRDEIIIPQDITHHLLHVFRHNLDKSIYVADKYGKNGIYKIEKEVDSCAIAHIIEYIDDVKSKGELVLVQSFLKGDKFDWVIQKVTELDVTDIYACVTKNCVVKYDSKKLNQKNIRWEKIIHEASQQCGRSHLPDFRSDLSIEEILDLEKESLCLVAYEDEKGRTLKEVLQMVPKEELKDKRILIIVGPEGGFNPSEIERMVAYGVRPVSLGSTILRAETAAVSAIAMIKYEIEL